MPPPPRPVRRRRGQQVYLRRRIAALILVVLLVVLLIVGVDKIVRAVQPSRAAGAGGRPAGAHASRLVTRPGSTSRSGSATGAGSANGAGSASGGVVPAAPPVTAPIGHTTVVLSAVGDVQLGTTGELPPDPVHYLDLVRSKLAAPIVVGNLDGVLGTGATGKCPAGSIDCIAFQDPPSYAAYLYADGFDVLNSANNHLDDFGAAGVTQTSATLQAAGIVQAGLPGQIGLISDGDTKVAFVDFAPSDTTNNLLDLPAAKALIQRAATLAPVVVVYMHAGAEGSAADHVTGGDESYLGEDRGNPAAFAKAAIDDGAAAVIASGPHVLRGMQFYRGHLIDYSLGDFAGYANFSTRGHLALSGILHLVLTPGGNFLQGSWTSLLLDGNGRPAVDPAAAAAKFVNGLSRADFGSTAALIGLDGSIEPAPTSSATTPG